MAATVIVNEFHGPTATPVKTDKTSGTVRFKNADNATVDLNDPMVIPTAGTDISFEKILRLNATGTFTSISNYGFYTDGANGLGTGVTCLYKKDGAYATPSEPGSNAGYTDIFARHLAELGYNAAVIPTEFGGETGAEAPETDMPEGASAR